MHMEEMKENQIMMLCQILDDRFNENQWQIIKKQSPESFLQKQQLILAKLLKEKKLFEDYFDIFYSNHVKLLNWSLLAVDRKAELSPYIFKTLVSKGSAFFNRKIKGLFQAKFKKKNEEKESLNLKQIKSMQQQVFKQFFHDMLERNLKQNPDKLSSMKLQSRRKQVENMDSHEFYIKTFNACNGWKYIFYNYEKHMKGLREKSKYNEKIRSNQQKSMLQRQGQNSLGLLDYEHPGSDILSAKTHNIAQVVQNSNLNSLKGFKNLVKQTNNKKLVFLNHQGKPITYRVSKT